MTEQCGLCLGTGKCQECNGDGRCNGTGECRECGGTGACGHCAGMGKSTPQSDDEIRARIDNLLREQWAADRQRAINVASCPV